GNYGVKVELPEPKELVGYTFVGWTINGEPVSEVVLTQNVTVKAEYQPITVSVKLVSDVAASGFTLENGKYVKTILLTYGTGAVELPTESNAGIALVAFKDDAGTLYYRVENLTEALTLYAVWEEIGYTVTFVDESGNVVKTLNAQAGDQISTRADVPAVPAKNGYTGAWNFGDDAVTEDVTIYPAYTANEYTVTVVSGLPYAGFAECANGYQKQFIYTYDGEPVSLDALADVSGYWFKGYYSEEGGEGTKLTAVSGITEDSTVYVWWQDNTVTVRLYSDLKFEKSVFDPQKNGYYVVADFNDEYALTYAPVVEGYQQLGWWHEENGAWTPVGDVERFHGQNSVDIWAVWIQNIDVVITDFSVNRTNLGITSTITYDIMGSFTGGSVVAGKSSEIFKEAPERTAQFVVYRNNKRDGLSGGDEMVIEGNTFRKVKMTCGNSGSSWNTAPYGGARITHTFTYEDVNGNTVPVSTADEHCISLETFRYEFYQDGELYDTVDIRGVYGEEVRLGNFLPAVPEKEGYTGSWLIDSDTVVDSGDRSTVNTSGINDIVTLYTHRVESAYTANSYAVRLESEQAIDGWTQIDNKYVYECEAEYGSSVTFYCDNNVLASYTVGTKDNLFTLPTLDADYIWSSVETTKSAIMCYAQRNVDTVVYVSEVSFDYQGVSYDSFSEEISADYSLIVPERAGYTFLGWYSNESGSWEKVTALESVNNGNAVTYRLHALWL
ncbi:MAG: InlB B-repeat-containing protein, partial [Clostridia bacterium]|nr:InlB B-repeat-containing protein [Clostridia bacterium]